LKRIWKRRVIKENRRGEEESDNKKIRKISS
jgi:hypothetical protein